MKSSKPAISPNSYNKNHIHDIEEHENLEDV